jgi:hypothetical protein
MNNNLWLKSFFRAPLLSPKGFVLRASLLAVGFGICELAGLRDHTTFLSGTSASAGGYQASVVFGVTYIVAYLGLAVVVPILLLAALLLRSWEARTAYRDRQRLREQSRCRMSQSLHEKSAVP